MHVKNTIPNYDEFMCQVQQGLNYQNTLGAAITRSIAIEADETSLAYMPNGQTAYVIDAELNRTSYDYDGFYRVAKTR